MNNIGKNILDIYPDAIEDTTVKGKLKSYLIPSEGMVVETTKNDIIIRIYDPLSFDEEDEIESNINL